MFETIFWGIKKVLKNLLFFTPRRNVTIEFQPAGPDFPYQGSRLEMNRYLEKWYNRPDGILPHKGEEPGESLYLVSYSMWKEELPEVGASQKEEAEIEISSIPAEDPGKGEGKAVRNDPNAEDQIEPEMDLAGDLGLDSLDNAEIMTFLDDQFDVTGVPVHELTTVGKVMAIAAKQISFGEEAEEEQKDLSKWLRPKEGQLSCPCQGRTIPEDILK